MKLSFAVTLAVAAIALSGATAARNLRATGHEATDNAVPPSLDEDDDYEDYDEFDDEGPTAQAPENLKEPAGNAPEDLDASPDGRLEKPARQQNRVKFFDPTDVFVDRKGGEILLDQTKLDAVVRKKDEKEREEKLEKHDDDTSEDEDEIEEEIREENVDDMAFLHEQWDDDGAVDDMAFLYDWDDDVWREQGDGWDN